MRGQEGDREEEGLCRPPKARDDLGGASRDEVGRVPLRIATAAVGPERAVLVELVRVVPIGGRIDRGVPLIPPRGHLGRIVAAHIRSGTCPRERCGSRPAGAMWGASWRFPAA